jgi:hypothetical protein
MSARPSDFPESSLVPAEENVAALIEELLGDRVITLKVILVDLTGSVNAALMLGQGLYWTKRTKHKDRWVRKTKEEWTEETRLSGHEQVTARKILRSLGFWHESRKGFGPLGVHGSTWFRIDRIALYHAVVHIDGKRRCTTQEPGDEQHRNPPIYTAQKRLGTTPVNVAHSSESTSESTSERSRRVKPEKGNDHRHRIEDDYHGRLLEFKADCLARSTDPNGQVACALDILIERVEEKDIRVQSVQYFDKALTEFFESSSDLELLKRRLAQRGRKRPGERQRGLFGEQ